MADRAMPQRGAVTSQMTEWIDVSVTVKHGMPHWPDNPPIVLERMMDLGRGDACNVSRLAMGVRSGTHMDGPVHFLHEAAGLDEMPLTATMGQARMIQIEHPCEITADEIRQHRLQAGERVLFRTSNSARCWRSGTFVEDFVYWIIEGLDLSPVTEGQYEMICLPVKLHGSDGAPARAILRPLGSHRPGQAVPAETAP